MIKSSAEEAIDPEEAVSIMQSAMKDYSTRFSVFQLVE